MSTRRLYYDDSFRREFDAQVLTCEAEVRDNKPAWGIVLDSTAFYPTSGGQPHDLGKLGETNVIDVLEHGDEIIHIVDGCLEKGSVHGCINWPRRYDHMQQHTGQHLLSAMFQERFGRPTVSFHLGDGICTIDLRGPEPSPEILEGAEHAANQIIADDRPLTVRYGTAEQFAEMGVRKEVQRSGILRAIEIEGADLQPCGGTHVARTAQIGIIVVRGCSKMRQDWRVEFVCGRRVVKLARQDFRLLQQASHTLGCSPDDLAASVDRILKERDAHFKSLKFALQRLAVADASDAVTSTSSDASLRIIAQAFDENTPPEYLNYFATELAKAPGTVALLGRTACGHLIFAQHPGVGRDMNALLKQVFSEFSGKGGGTKDFVRGRLSDPAQAAKAVERAKALAAHRPTGI
jgi:alanyl-tRNA synthetase